MLDVSNWYLVGCLLPFRGGGVGGVGMSILHLSVEPYLWCRPKHFCTFWAASGMNSSIDMKYVFYEILASTLKFQLIWDMKRNQMRLMSGVYVFSKYICILTNLVELSLLTKNNFVVLSRTVQFMITNISDRYTSEILSECTPLLELHSWAGKKKAIETPSSKPNKCLQSCIENQNLCHSTKGSLQ